MATETVRIEIPIETVDETAAGLHSAIQGMSKLEQAYRNAGQSAKKADREVSQFDRRAQKTEKSLSNWARSKYEIMLEAKDRVAPVLSALGGRLKNFAGKTWGVTMRAIDLVTSPVRGIINLLKNPIFQVGAVLGVSIGLKDTIETYKNFEAAISQVQAVSGATGAEVAKLTEKAKEMGATTKFTAKESADAFKYMAMAGWKTEDMLGGIEGILNLAAASGEDLATTSDIVTDALTAFGMKASDAGRFSDVLAIASSNANTNVSMMGETFKYVGAASGALGYSIEDVALGIGLMANAGIKASQAGTELNSIFTRLATNTNGSRDAIEALGISFYEADGNARFYRNVLDDMREATNGMTREQKVNFANAVAGQRAQAGLLAMLNATEKDYKKLTASIEECDGAAAGMSETMLDNLQGSLTLMQSAVDGAKNSFGERLSPYVRGLADWITAQMPAVEQGLEEFMDWVDTGTSRMQRKFNEIKGTEEWQDADFFGKVKIAWDEFIAEPFSDWWSSTGKAKFADFAQDIGAGIGTGLKVGIMALLGIDLGETLDEGVSIGASFAKGFSEGFDFKALSSKLFQGLGNMLSSAGKLLPGGKTADLSSIFSAVILSRIAKPFFSMGRGAFSLGRVLFGGSSGGGSILGSLLGSTGNAMVGGSGILGRLADIGYGLSKGSGTAGMYYGDMSGTMSGGMAALKGAGAAGGAIAAGATIISGSMDIYKAVKSQDADETAAYAESGAWKMGGVAAGAAAGAALGSVIPGLGTAVGALVGSGVGGIAGWIKGNKVKEEYQENVEEMQKEAEKAQKVFEATGLAIENVKFKNEALTQAMNDSEVSAEQFAQMFQEECANVAQKAFGDISLSLAEVKKVASEITFADMAEGLIEFAQVTAEADTALNNLQSSVVFLKKENWKVGLGMELSETDKDSYKGAIENFISSAQTFIDDNQYEATVALRLLTSGNADTSGLDSYYGGLKSQVEDLGTQLKDAMNIALEDSVITLDEAAELESLQEQIAAITGKLTEAKTDAEMQALQIKYNGAALDMDSFNALQEELQANVASASEQYESALTLTLTNLNLQLADGAITQEEYDSAVVEATDGYNAQINELNARVSSFNLESIAAAWESGLSGFMPEIEGTAAEKLGAALNNAIASHPDVAAWNTSEVRKWIGLDKLNLSTEEQTTIAEELIQTALAVPEGTKEQIIKDFQSQIPTSEEIKAAVGWDNMNLGGVNELIESVADQGAMEKTFGEFYGSGIGQAKEAYSHALQAAISEAWSEALAGAVEERPDVASWDASDIIGWLGIDKLSLSEGEQSGLAELIQTALAVPEGSKDEILQSIKEQMPTAEEIEELINWDSMDFEGWDALMEGITGSATADVQEKYFGDYASQMKEAALSALQNALSGSTESLSKFMEQYMADAASGCDFGSIMEQYGPISDEYYTQIVSEWQEAGTAYGNALNNGASTSLRSGSPILRSGLQTALDAATATPLTINPVVNVNPKYSVSSSYFPTIGLGTNSRADGGGRVKKHAAGGYVSGGPQLSWLAEEGYGEFIIPTNPSRRSRALELYKQAGTVLGVSAHAAGGYVGGSNSTDTAAHYNLFSDANRNAPIADNEISEGGYDVGISQPYGQIPLGSGSTGGTSVQVNIIMAPEFAIHGGSGDGNSEEDIIRVVKKHLKEMADELGGEIAAKLEQVFSNMPLKEA